MNEKIKEIARKLGQLGGKKTKEKYGKDYYARIGRKGAEKRWAKSKDIGLTPSSPNLPSGDQIPEK